MGWGLYVVGLVVMVCAWVSYRRYPSRFSVRSTASTLLWYFVAVWGVSAIDPYVRSFLALVYKHSLPWGGSFVLLLVLDDFVQYWAHRAAHAWRFYWAGHRVHHSSTDFNILVSIRSAPWEQIPATAFMACEVALGFDPSVVIAVRAVSIMIQNSMHRRSNVEVRDWVRLVFVTPGFHELHHGSNKCYWDRNFGAVLSVWDHLFRTAVSRTEAPVFGVR